MSRWIALLVLAACQPSAPELEATQRIAVGPDSDKLDPAVIVGKPATWDVDWMGATPIAPADLRGQVVLVRWFTEGCQYCLSTAPTLVALHEELAPKGLRVIGMYHHKSAALLEPSRVRAFARERLGFTFPIAIDHDWKTLRAWWPHEGFTSVSFLVDRCGIVRFVHTGGSYAPGSDDAAQVRRWIDQLLGEPSC
jgi:thiol-disulfide isomerase/thioredoxin